MASATSTASVSSDQVSVKLHIHRSRETEVRRFTAPATFDELKSIVSHLWGSAPRRLAVEYVDDEGDRVRMTTPLEWDECLRLFRQVPTKPGAPLVLHAVRAKGPRSNKVYGSGATSAAAAAAASSSSDDDEPHAEQQQPAGSQAAATTPASQGGSRSLPAEQNPRRAPVSESQQAALALMSELYGCDAEAVLSTPLLIMSHPQIARLLVRGMNVSDCGDLHLDIDLIGLRREAVREGNRRIDVADHARAERLLELATRVFANDDVILYNLACAQARQSKADAAFATLDRAIAAGYANWDHAQRDTDLISLRGDARFTTMIRSMRSKEDSAAAAAAAATPLRPATAPAPVAAPTQQQPPVVAAAAEPVKPADAPKAPDTPRTVKAKVLLDMFPTLGIDQARVLIADNHGDVNGAAHAVLRSMTM